MRTHNFRNVQRLAMDVWKKQEGETSKAYDWFCKYRDMGTDRSISKVVQKYNKNTTYRRQLAKWSILYNWISRVEAYDTHLENLKRDENENRVLETAEQQIDLANIIMDKCLRNLAVLDEINNPTQWKSLAEFAVKTKRDALGIAEKHDVSGSIDVNDKTALRISKEFLERTERLLAVRGDCDRESREL